MQRNVHTSTFATLLHGGHLFAKLDVEVFTIAHVLGYRSSVLSKVSFEGW